MTPPLVLDASAVVALLLDADVTGEWVAEQTRDAVLAAPELALFETASILRRQAAAGAIDAVVADLAHLDLLALHLDLWPYPLLAERCWQLGGSLTIYDASYVALAELLGSDLVTLDIRLSRANGPRCRIVTPPAA